jgi:hypothetical protein
MIKLKNLLIKEEEPVIRKKKFHIGGGVYVDNEKDKDNPKAQRFSKDDSGKYIPIDDSGKKEPKNVPNIFDKPKDDGPNPTSKDKPLVKKEKSPTSTFDAPIEPHQIDPNEVQQAIDHIKETNPELADELDGHLEDIKWYGNWSDEDNEFFDDDFSDPEHGEDAERAGWHILNKIRNFNKKNAGSDKKEPKNVPAASSDKKKIKSVQKNTIIKKKVLQKLVLQDLAKEYDEAKDMGDTEEMEKIKSQHFIHKMHFEAQKLALDVIETQGDFNIDKVKEVVAGDPDKYTQEDIDEALTEIDELIDDVKSDDDHDRSEVKQLAQLRRRLEMVGKEKSIKENYNPSDKFLTESIDLLEREFGQPLPTLSSVMEKHQKNVKEGPDDVKITKKQLQMLIKQEGAFRKRMLNIEQGFLRDPRPENKKLAKDIKKSYKDNVTKFMREVVGMLKRMK